VKSGRETANKQFLGLWVFYIGLLGLTHIRLLPLITWPLETGSQAQYLYGSYQVTMFQSWHMSNAILLTFYSMRRTKCFPSVAPTWSHSTSVAH